MRDKALMVNVLWDTVCGLHHKALCLDSLEDFNATEADLMSMKDDILATWKSRDARKTSSLGPTFVTSVDSRSQGSTLGKTFIPRGATAASGALHGALVVAWVKCRCHFPGLWPHHPGFPQCLDSHLYLQELLPTSFPMMGSPAEYNFDPITGQPLKALTPDMYSLSSQPRDVLFPTSTSPHITGLSNLPGLIQEERPLVVGPPSHSSQVVAGRRVPTVTVSSSTAETTLSSSPIVAPRLSTSCSNMMGGDVCRVVWQHPHSPPSRILATAGAGRGLVSRPTKHVLLAEAKCWSTCLLTRVEVKVRGWLLSSKENSGGRGQSIPFITHGKARTEGRTGRHSYQG